MSLADWAENGWLKSHTTSPQEIGDQLVAAGRDLADAGKDLSASWRFAIAYNAGLRLCSVALFASGYRAAREQKHYRTIAALPLVIGDDADEISAFLDRCRVKRHDVTYEAADPVSAAEADELIVVVYELDRLLREWLERQRPELLGRM